MSMIPVPAELDCLEDLRLFLAAVLPANTPAFKTQVNRVPEPVESNFVMYTPTFRKRLSTNVDSYDDCQFTGFIAADVLTVTDVAFGTIGIDRLLFGVGVAAATRITAQITGSGGVGTYRLNVSQTVSSRKLAAGIEKLKQPIELTVQTDFYGPLASDNAQTFSTLFRDEYGTAFFAELSNDVVPLYTDDPKQVAFTNEQQQYQDRWIVNAMLQVNATIEVPQQFADSGVVGLISVDERYPVTSS